MNYENSNLGAVFLVWTVEWNSIFGLRGPTAHYRKGSRVCHPKIYLFDRRITRDIYNSKGNFKGISRPSFNYLLEVEIAHTYKVYMT